MYFEIDSPPVNVSSRAIFVYTILIVNFVYCAPE